MKIILFDIDETLLSCINNGNALASRQMFKNVFNINADENDINNIGKTEKGIIEEIIRLKRGLNDNEEVEIPNKAYLEWTKGLSEVILNHPPIILPGIPELLDTLSRNPEIKLGLLTGNSRLRAEAKLKAIKLDKYFLNDKEILMGAFGDIGSKRSDLIQIAREKYGDGTYIIIDDSIIAGKMSKENNLPAILVATGKATEEELKKYSEYVFKDFGENRWQEVIEAINSIED